MTVLSHKIICSVSPADDKSVEMCKDYIKRFGLTKEDVALRINKECVYVETKREVSLNGKS
jgi:hypothetical protein